jgi:hypothetical protein
MVPNMKVNTFKERNTELEDSHGLMVQLTMESSLKITSKAKENTTGLTEENMTDSGWTTKWREKVFSPGQMAEDMREIMLMTRRKVKEFSSGLMAESTRVAGKTESNMESVLIPPLVVKLNKESGKMERDSTGFKINEYNFSI